MGINSALYTGVSGLNTNGNAMSVIGNNIANTNTVGFKSSRTIFSDLLSATISGSGGTSQVGRGTQLSVVDNIFSQGTFENTESNTDLAIEGDGFFIVKPSGAQDTFYTRAGGFRFNEDGFLVNPEGLRVQGKAFEPDGTLSVGDPSDIQVDIGTLIPAQESESISMNTNLDSNATAITGGFNVLTPSSTSNYATSTRVFDSLGDTHLLTTYFTKTGANTWDWNTVGNPSELQSFEDGRAAVVAAGQGATGTGVAADVTAAMATEVTDLQTVRNTAEIGMNTAQSTYDTTPSQANLAALNIAKTDFYDADFQLQAGQSVLAAANAYAAANPNDDVGTVNAAAQSEFSENVVIGSGSLEFDVDGNLVSGVTGETNYGSLSWDNGSDLQQLSYDFNMTQYSSDSIVISQGQDGYGAGSLVKISIDGDGIVTANYSNGERIDVSQIALAKFPNAGGLAKAGSNLYEATDASGNIRTGVPGSELGKIFTNALEQSNVDLAQEFVKMITTQRGFQANSKIITTTDELLAELINLKR